MKKFFTLFAALVLAVAAMAEPISELKDTVYVNINSKSLNRLRDLTATEGFFELEGQDNNNEYYLVFVCNAEQLTGYHTTDSVDAESTVLYNLTGDTTEIKFNILCPNAYISGDPTSYNASINYVGADSVLYIITYNFTAPQAKTTLQFTATDAVLNDDDWKESGVFSVHASNSEYTFDLLVSTDNTDIPAQYTVNDYNVRVSVYKTDSSSVIYEGYSGALTVAKGDQITVIGDVLCYGDVKFNVNISGTLPVENVQISDINVYTIGNAIIINGAEGEDALICDVAGRTVANTRLTSDNASFAVAEGIYFVRINGKTTKVMVK